MSLLITEKLIQRQINNWNRFREFLPEPPESENRPPGPIITISRRAGSGGRTLATALAERLGLQLHDQSIVEKIVQDSNLANDMVDQLDEKELTQAKLWVRGVLNQKIFMRDQYHMALVKVVTNLAARGNAIFLGRGANLILGHNATLRVQLVASRPTRVNNICKRTGLSKPEARALLEETDRQRTEFIRRVFRQKPDLSDQFDLVLNTDRVKPECQIELVLLALLGQEVGGMKPAAETLKSEG